MTGPSEAQVEAAVAAYWERWRIEHERAGLESRAVTMLERPEIAQLNRVCMRDALIAAAGEQ